MIPLRIFLDEEWMKKSGALGSNPGGVYVHADTAERRYVKFYPDEQQARSEVASGNVYRLLGVPTLNPEVHEHNGEVGVSTKWDENIKPHGGHFKKWDDETKVKLAKHYVAAVATGNWDAIGVDHLNLQTNHQGHLVSVDNGAAFGFSARGAEVPFRADGPDADVLRQKKHPLHDVSVAARCSAEAFSTLGNHHIRQALSEMPHLEHREVFEALQSAGVDSPKEKAHVVVSRLNDLRSRHTA